MYFDKFVCQLNYSYEYFWYIHQRLPSNKSLIIDLQQIILSMMHALPSQMEFEPRINSYPGLQLHSCTPVVTFLEHS